MEQNRNEKTFSYPDDNADKPIGEPLAKVVAEGITKPSVECLVETTNVVGPAAVNNEDIVAKNVSADSTEITDHSMETMTNDVSKLY